MKKSGDNDVKINDVLRKLQPWMESVSNVIQPYEILVFAFLIRNAALTLFTCLVELCT